MESFLTVGNHDFVFQRMEGVFMRVSEASVYYFIIKTPFASDLFICLDTGSGTIRRKTMKSGLTKF